MIPIHWGTYFPIHLGLKGKPAFLDMPPLEFEAALRTAAPDVELRVLRPGEEFRQLYAAGRRSADASAAERLFADLARNLGDVRTVNGAKATMCSQATLSVMSPTWT